MSYCVTRRQRGLLARLQIALSCLTFFSLLNQGSASDLDDIGVSTLRVRDSSLNGAGIAVGQVEAQFGDNSAYQVDPAHVGQSADKFKFYDSSHPYPLGGSFSIASDHANDVAGNFYGVSTGVAPGVASMAIFDADYFANSIIFQAVPLNVGARIINQSFVFTGLDSSTASTVHSYYDNYAAQYGTLFISGAGNSGDVSPPSTMYNGISVGAIGLSLGQLADGRSKPDIIAPGGLTSYTTPYVSGAAAVLMQSALRGDGGSDTTAAVDARTVKALLLNGAVKPSGWAHTSTHPLDTTSGAGVLNVDRSQRQLVGGKFTASATSGVAANALHPPPGGLSVPLSSYIGWNFGSITNTNTLDTIDNYLVNLSAADSATYTLTSTLVWNRRRNQTSLNNLDLYLYNYDSGEIVSVSSSTVDNVEHLYVQNLSPGKYVLQVVKLTTGRVSASEDYALVFSFAPLLPATPLTISASPISAAAIDLAWSDTATNETGYRIERSLSPDSGFTALATLAANSTSYHDTGLTMGTAYYYRVVAFNAGGDAPAASVQRSTYSERDLWRLEHFETAENAGTAADESDPDEDGLSNAVEYALGTDPQSADGADGSAARPVFGVVSIDDEDYLTIQIHRNQVRSDVSYVVEFSETVDGPWGSAVTVLTDTANLLEVRANLPIASLGSGYLRFSVVVH